MWIFLGLSFFVVFWIIERGQKLTQNGRQWQRQNFLDQFLAKFPMIKMEHPWWKLQTQKELPLIKAPLKKLRCPGNIPKIFLHEYSLIASLWGQHGQGARKFTDFIFHSCHRLLSLFLGNWTWVNNRMGALSSLLRALSTLFSLGLSFVLWSKAHTWWSWQLSKMSPRFSFLEENWASVWMFVGVGLLSASYGVISWRKIQTLYTRRFDCQRQVWAAKNWQQKQFWQNQLAQEILHLSLWGHAQYERDFSRALYFAIHGLYSACPGPFLFSEKEVALEWQRFVQGHGSKAEAKMYLEEYGLWLEESAATSLATSNSVSSAKQKLAEVKKVA